MRTLGKLTMLLFFTAAITSCGGPEGEKAETTQAKEVKTSTEGAIDYSIQPRRSMINWEGSKPGGSHQGTIDVKEGSFKVKEDEIVGGRFVIDMTSIKDNDIKNPEDRAKLENHLKSSDFFHVEKYPTAIFEITDLKEAEPTDDFKATHKVTGNLTMKDSTKNITFPAHIEFVGNFIKAESDRFVIDRSKWNVRYGSRTFFDDLQNKYIHDDIALRIRITAEQ
ncbi:MAG: YceI family protein [Bacteroidales bacterium]|nr:YceI family protein [Bacteroidales bacterium]